MSKKRSWWKPRRSRRSQRWALAIVVATLVVAGVYVQRGYTWVVAFPTRPAGGTSAPIELVVPSGASFPQVLELLVDKGVVAPEQATYFKFFVLHKGAARKTTAGPHEFRGDMTPLEIVEELARKQKVAEIKTTIPEGKNILEVAQILADSGLSDAQTLEAAMRDPQMVKALGIEGETVEGYLFPDTYKFRTEATPQEILERLVARHRQVFADLRRRYRDSMSKLKERLQWGHREVVILASIVEKETAAERERPLIAGVFLNRLRFSTFKPKLLQTDPTIVYGCVVPERKSSACEQFEGRIRTIHLRDKDNPYSTYAHEGLPPGPIANPGRAALEAVLAPTASRYLYFVSRNDDTHYFSKTVSEHERAVDEFQRGIDRGLSNTKRQ